MNERTVVITGAAGAIGAVVARRFAEAGWQLGLIDYGDDRAASLREDFPDAHVASADLTDFNAAQDAIAAIQDHGGPVDALLNIAGGFAMQPAHDATDDDLAKMHKLNVVTLFNATRAALPSMQERGNGFILGVSAAAALDGAGGAALYAAGKAAVAAYLKSLHAELHSDGIRTSVVYPMGMVDTEANRQAMPDGDPQTWISRDEIAESMLHLANRSARGHVRELKIFAPSIDL